MVPTKKVDKTSYEIWHGKAPNLSYLKVWGCEAYVKHDLADKLHKRSVNGRDNDLEDDHMDKLPSENTSEILVESESLGSPPELIPVRRIDYKETCSSVADIRAIWILIAIAAYYDYEI
nr:retrotransposon protein, putative, Ty1-copia subclass [Tanacetum cinerariifolium]